jgi:hypothetical protein
LRMRTVPLLVNFLNGDLLPYPKALDGLRQEPFPHGYNAL